MELVYDVAHNIAKRFPEVHAVDGREKAVWVQPQRGGDPRLPARAAPTVPSAFATSASR